MLGKNITVSAPAFAAFAQKATESGSRSDRRGTDFAAAFGSEVCTQEKKDRIQYTSLCFITGSGHQDFLEAIKGLQSCTTAEHVRKALFGTWDFRDKGLSLRWDPGEAREYAMLWGDPGKEGAWTEWGANRLAIEALPMFPSYPESQWLETIGFSKFDRVEEFTWPIWTEPVSCDTIRSILALKELQQEQPSRRILSAMGIAEVYRSSKVKIGNGANFKVSFRPARAV